ncbi:MAG TPA: tocopherol cyclase family protein [Acidimicrobiales bacterium]|nr:tocopherol cyclase family protein [Acidimicrobiales bacterium]
MALRVRAGRATSSRLLDIWRRTGADLPGGDPRPTHSAQMEGYFWRFTDTSTGRVVVVLCGINRHPDGDWATVAIALHPGLVVRSAVVGDASADSNDLALRAGDGFHVTDGGRRVRVAVDDVTVDATVDDSFGWPLKLGGGGVFSAVPLLNQYWHPHVLGGRADVRVAVPDGAPWELSGANVYAEKNWGRGFPDRWWWGQAQGFPDRDDVCVAWSGGVLSLGPLRATVGGAIARVEDTVLRLTPPLAIVRSSSEGGEWRVRATGHAGSIEIAGDGRRGVPHTLPVPLPAERRNIDTDFEHLAGHVWCSIRPRRGPSFEGESELAGLEVGSLDGTARP